MEDLIKLSQEDIKQITNILSDDIIKHRNKIKEILDKYPDLISLHKLIGNAYYNSNSYKNAIECYERILPKIKHDTNTMINIGKSYLMLGNDQNFEKIITETENEIEKQNLKQKHNLIMVKVLHKLKQNKPKEMAELIRKAMEIDKLETKKVLTIIFEKFIMQNESISKTNKLELYKLICQIGETYA